MNLPLRQQSIVERVHEHSYLNIGEMAQASAVTPQTIRHDINQLAEQGLLYRYRGSVVYDSSTENTAYTMRANQMRGEKQYIAEVMTSLAPDNVSLFINIDTTTEAITYALLNHRNLKTIINNLHAATTLDTKKDLEVLVAGGTVCSDGGVVGRTAVDSIQQFRVDFILVGINGVDEDGSLLDSDYQEMRVSQVIIDNARQVFPAADPSKFGYDAVVHLGPISLVNWVISDSPSSAAIARLMAQHRIHLDPV